jgi:uracil-DNA glycosylase
MKTKDSKERMENHESENVTNMQRSEIANSIYDLLNLYKDMINSGYKKKYEEIDFSVYDKIFEIPPEQKIETVKIEKNQNAPIIQKKKRELIELAGNIIKCNNCKINSKIKIPGSGNISAEILVLSYFPTIEEEKQEKPFAGEMGDFFRKWIESIKMNYDSLFVTHLIKCNPRMNQISRESIQACLKHFDAQLLIIKPVVIFALGEVVLSSLCRKYQDIASNHGKVFNYNGIPFIATYHPVDVLKDPLLKKTVWEDLKKFSAFYNGRIQNGK